MRADVDVTIRFADLEILVGYGETNRDLTPDQAKRLAQLLELAANAVEKAAEMGENDDCL